MEEKTKCFLALDVGTEAVKALIFKKEVKKRIILGYGLSYFDRWGVFNGQDFWQEVMHKAILTAIREAERQAQVSPCQSVLVALPATISWARIISQDFKRQNPKKSITEKEKAKIYRQTIKESQKKVTEDFAKTFGILPDELEFLNQTVTASQIDGYEVSNLKGYRGEKLSMRVFLHFSAKSYLQKFRKILEDFAWRDYKIIYPASNLTKIFGETPAFFLDIGGELTQMFLLKNGKIEMIDEFKIGGKTFSRVLSQTLGLNEDGARVMKERYFQKLLSEQSRARLREIFSEAVQEWFNNLKLRLEQSTPPFFYNILLFGGGSQLFEIEEILEKKWAKVQYIYPKQLRQFQIEDQANILKTPQDINPILICLYE